MIIMGKGTYVVFKIINWILTIGFILLSALAIGGTEYGFMEGTENYYHIVAIGYFLFLVIWFFKRDTNSRILYQMWVFIAYIYADFVMFVKPDYASQLPFAMHEIDASTVQMIVLAAVSVLALFSKVMTMAHETREYKSHDVDRYNQRLENKVISAESNLKLAKGYDDVTKAKAKLDKARDDRDRYTIKK